LPISVSSEEDACTFAPSSISKLTRPAAGNTKSRRQTGITRVP
jgi:hypothetical protein